MAKTIDLGKVVSEVPINDAAPSAKKVYSSQKTQNELDRISQQLAEYRTAQNLLINSYFRRITNQRGQQSYTGAKYGFDMWYGATSGSKPELVTGASGLPAIRLSHDGTSSNRSINQKLTRIQDELIGKTVTLAVCLDDGSIFVRSGVVTVDVSIGIQIIDSSTATAQLRWSDGEMICQVFVRPGASIDIAWCALYVGGFTAETLPEFAAPDPDVELIKCQRFFHVYETQSARPSMPLDCCPPMILAPGTTAVSQGTVTTSDGKTLYYNSTEP